MDTSLVKAAEVLAGSRFTLALTGAGISVESGIPDFRSAGGLWARFNPAEYATIEAFRQDPHKVWRMLAEMDRLLVRSRPNPAHLGLAELERLGYLQFVITQNVDNLHQAGGSQRVIEFHGNAATLACLACHAVYSRAEVSNQAVPPKCVCGQVLKPEVIFFGEEIPPPVLAQAHDLVSLARVLLVIGTSAEVAPASMLPRLAKEHGATIVEINPEKTRLTDELTDILLQGRAGEIIPALVAELKRRTTDGWPPVTGCSRSAPRPG
ncbi:SIR2 family NAD-dependent protein deacylase [Desulfurivibrio alkaliphilus]|uniref:protein acetyllysine N-acetyltransferase n=1 Tax=Desulfurivibrio alkaliphilus (strain DSM 19089 / UNIQEM U267 / AHT2) TaxID=589865 RepID=D6Z5U2_DESAT|nr:NAD-dependent deacylase [Desulfurivibrio alkaliphilus]ADH84824.1 Silent information regulator protein Sir2 [Desulfurivibrio alkaliphilus AHT 2]